MKRSKISLFIFLCMSAIVIGFGGLYLYKYFRRWAVGNIEREQLNSTAREIAAYKSLGFSDDSRLCASLEQYTLQLHDIIAQRDQEWCENEHQIANINVLLAVNKKMLKSYIRDVQEYRQAGMQPTDGLMKFSYDKVVRLTLSLVELKKAKSKGIAQEDYFKKVDRMKEITLQSIAHSKNKLRNLLAMGQKETDQRVICQRKNLTARIDDLIALNKVLYL